MQASDTGKKSFNEWSYWWHAFRIARRSCTFASTKRIGIRKVLGAMLAPVNSFVRYGEYSLFEELLELRPDISVLDVGSPKMFGLLLASSYELRISLTDIWVEDLMNWEYIAKEAGLYSKGAKLEIFPLDGRSTTLPDRSFDRIYMMSVLEHIPDDGDIKAVREMSRLLRENGLLVISVPATTTSKIQYRTRQAYGIKSNRGANIYFQRLYDLDSINERLVVPSGLVVEKVIGLGIKESIAAKLFSVNYQASVDVFDWRYDVAAYGTSLLGFLFPAMSKVWRLRADAEEVIQGQYYADIVIKLRNK